MFAEFYGTPLHNESDTLNGIHKVIYPNEISLDRYKRVKECPVCGSTHFKGDKCAICGTYIFNFCSDYLVNGEEGCSYANPGNARFCEVCGKPTYYFLKGFIKTWDEKINKD